MNLIRSILSVFLVILFVLSIAGWFWASDLPSAKRAGARIGLGLCGLSSAGCLWMLWKEKPDRSEPKSTTDPDSKPVVSGE